MYTNKGAIQNYLMIDIDSSFDAQITNWISAVQQYIENYTRRIFETVDEVRYFDGNGMREIQIDDFTEITTVEILEVNGSGVEYTLTEGLDDDFITYPYNATTKYKLLMTANSEIGCWLEGAKRIKITAKWSTTTSVPKDIEYVATVLVAKIIEKGMSGGKISSESLGDYSVTFADMDSVAEMLSLKKILDKYILIEL